MNNITIRASQLADRSHIADILTAAFPTEAEIILTLVEQLWVDPTAQPCLSLVAERSDSEGDRVRDRVAGYVLFSAVRLQGHESTTASPIVATILAPLAVHPDWQNQGIGGQLIRTGLEHLKATGTDLVFVLGYPDYYQRHGFHPAGVAGFEATYPVPVEQADAWMVQELRPGAIGRVRGRVLCSTALDNPIYWQD